MHGNVLEWCQGIYGPYTSGIKTDPISSASGSKWVIRGGGITNIASYCRSGYRDAAVPDVHNIRFGFEWSEFLVLHPQEIKWGSDLIFRELRPIFSFSVTFSARAKLPSSVPTQNG
tara:strand:- start:51327 stop:51674 length:348 start_codon:yes stop_codon:yes gene_type:complete